MDAYDAIITGTGAGGVALTRRLAPSGKRVLLLERGAGGPTRQPLRRRHESFPEHRRGEPGAHRDSQRAPRRRPPARTVGLMRGER